MLSITSPSDQTIPLSVYEAGEDAVLHYLKMIEAGQTPRFAEMCAVQQAPAVKGTDRSYMQGRYNNQQLDKMPVDHARNVIALAKRAGVSISGKYYAAGLADHRGPGDPKAWVDSTADVVRVAKEKNLTVMGAVEHQGIPQPRPKSKPLSDRLTKEMMRAEAPANPKMKKAELREYVIDKYGRKPR